MKEPNAKKNACWVFETVRIISIIISLICFTEKVYGSSPYSPIHFCIHFLISACDRPVDCSIEMESFPQDHGDPSGLENNNLFQWIQSDRYFQISDKQTHSSSLIFVCEWHTAFFLFYLSMIQDLVIHLCFGIPKSIYEVKIITWAWLKKNSNLTQPNQIQIQSNSKSHYLEPILVLVFVEKPEFQKRSSLVSFIVQ